jgi:DNA-binding transcriptional MocR family regulator
MEGSEIGRHLKPLNRPGARALPDSYGSPLGFQPLRERIALTLAERSIQIDAAQVLLTHGANHALDLIIRHLVAPGDTVLVDSPGYYPLFGKLRLAKATMVGVKRDADGPDLDDLAEKVANTSAKVFFTQSLAHNPTGCSITMPVAHRVLRIAAAHDLLIVENDPFADVVPTASVRLAALDQLERVVYIGTFAKTLSASLRSGYVTADKPLIEALCDLKMLTTVNSSGYVERIIHDLIVTGQYRRHLKRLASRIDEAARLSRDILHDLNLPILGHPAGGFYMWCALPQGTSDIELSRRAAEQDILLAPGSIFHADHADHSPAMRVNIAYADKPAFRTFMRQALYD